MEYPWRPFPPTATCCPVCSNSHFPFCPPPPPPPHYFRPPPPPPDQFLNARQPPPPQPSYDPFVDHQAGLPVNPYPPPQPSQVPPRPWSGNPNLGESFCENPYLDYDQNGQVGAKRMRSDNVNEVYGGLFSEDERRLKLIRDHGAVAHGTFDGGYRHSLNSFETNSFNDKKGKFGDRQGINPQMKPSYGDQQFAYQHPENIKNVELGRSYNHSEINGVPNHIYGNSVHGSDGHDAYKNYKHPVGNHETLQYDTTAYQEQRRNFPIRSRDNQFLQPTPGQITAGLMLQPPLPTNSPPPLPPEPPKFRFAEHVVSTSAPGPGPGSLFPIAVNSASRYQSPYALVSEGISSVSTLYSSKANPSSTSYYSKEIQSMKVPSSKAFKGEHEGFPCRHLSSDEPKLIDASHILKHPHRANRPDHIVIILRGLPGSGKSYLAKIVRDLEVESGGSAPRIHSMDDYFMTEVEESDVSKSSASIRGKKPVIKKIMEYCYEPEMEEAYRTSMLKAFKKTLDEGTFPFVIVDDRNLRVADFAQFWATAKRSGYEVYLLEATYKDPAGCAARNVHGFTQHDINNMADKWEEAPSMYMKLDSKSLLHGDDLEENGIQEVDMDADDGNYGSDPSGSADINNGKVIRLSEGDSTGEGPLEDKQNEASTGTHPVETVSELRKSKWSNDLDEDDRHQNEAAIESSSSLSNLIESYSKKGKSVRWADKVGSVGFSISSGKTANVSLVIGSGCGYNLKSNPLPEEEKRINRSGEPRRQNIFQEQLRAEHESFKAVFDKRKHRIGRHDVDEE